MPQDPITKHTEFKAPWLDPEKHKEMAEFFKNMPKVAPEKARFDSPDYRDMGGGLSAREQWEAQSGMYQ